MSAAGLWPGLTARVVATPRLRTFVIEGGDPDGVPVLFIHGNVSANPFWEETLAALPGGLRGIAPDLRGYGGSETLPVDATRGLRDFADDLWSLVETLNLGAVHLVGWSLGGNVAMQYAIDHPRTVASLVLVAPGSPRGFGGTKDLLGTPVWPDFAGSGGGTANPDFVRLLGAGDRSDSSPVSPRNVLNSFYFKPPFRAAPEREERYVGAMLAMAVGEGNYPGDLTTSDNWPGIAPGTRGVNNALAPAWGDQAALATIAPQPPILWLRGADDQIVSDTSLFDFGFLGQLGAVPAWPGKEIYPPQPMIGQLRAVLETYHGHGGSYREEVLAECGHSPHVEKPAEFRALAFGFLREAADGA